MWRQQLADLGEGPLEAALRLHAHFQGVQRVDGPLRGRARHCAGDDVTGRLGVNLRRMPLSANKHPLPIEAALLHSAEDFVALIPARAAWTVQGRPIFYNMQDESAKLLLQFSRAYQNEHTVKYTL